MVVLVVDDVDGVVFADEGSVFSVAGESCVEMDLVVAAVDDAAAEPGAVVPAGARHAVEEVGLVGGGRFEDADAVAGDADAGVVEGGGEGGDVAVVPGGHEVVEALEGSGFGVSHRVSALFEVAATSVASNDRLGCGRLQGSGVRRGFTPPSEGYACSASTLRRRHLTMRRPTR